MKILKRTGTQDIYFEENKGTGHILIVDSPDIISP
jgi:hypothetical protein